MKNSKISLMKFTIVAVMIGLFSPSVSVNTNIEVKKGYAVAPFEMSVSLFNVAEARRGRGSSRGNRSHTKRSSNRNRNSNKNVNVNRNVNKNVNVNVNHHHHGHGHNRYYGRPGYYAGRPLAVFTTSLIIGSMIAASTMPSSCVTVVTNGISYRKCGSSYYQPFYEGDNLVYKVVVSPY